MELRAYDIEMLPGPADRASPENHGWCFGLPPGIVPEQWPLDPNNGFPLMHGFTLLLPDDYRCHGPDMVALSFFATPWDMNDGAPVSFADVQDACDPAPPRPADPKLAAVGDAAHRAAPRLFRMRDILGCAYAVVLLTRAMFDGPLCRPPPLVDPDRAPLPQWLEAGAATSFYQGDLSTRGTMADADNLVFKRFGAYPDGDLAFHQAFHWTARANDPNAGLAPQERWAEEKSGYQPEWIEVDGVPVHQNRAWTKDHAENHIGGTMSPVQNIPDGFSPYYVEFDEDFGGYNFGSCGKGQLDFKTMRFDWADG